MKTAVVAEKPSVARDIARALGAGERGDGYLQGNGYKVTWALGHLVRLPEPHEIDSVWKSWRRENLPMLPEEWPIKVIRKTRKQFNTVKRIINDRAVGRVVCATDAGREGELIFRLIYEAAGCVKPVERLWISSLTEEAIKEGFENLKPGGRYDSLASAARGRSRADWLVGMNFSRAYSLSHKDHFSVGRVQTPTLAMIVDRELEIRNFVPEKYLQIYATFSRWSEEGERSNGDGREATESYKGVWFRDKEKGSPPEWPKEKELKEKRPDRLPDDVELAERIIERVVRGSAQITSINSREKSIPPPLLYDLAELQRDANRFFGYSAEKTLQIAQKLYERRKLISYPRTDSRRLDEKTAGTLEKIVRVIEKPYRAHLPFGERIPRLGRRFVDDSKVTDHHAVIPTAVSAEGKDLTREESRIYDLVCRRLLSAWLDNYITKSTTVITEVESISSEDGKRTVDHFKSRGIIVEQLGWKVLEYSSERYGKNRSWKGQEPEEQALPAFLRKGQKQNVVSAEYKRKQTKPPPRFNDAALLTAMETAGKSLDSKELSDIMKECGLGTPATRAAIIETLIRRGYISRKGKTFYALEKGIRLIDSVHPHVKSPEMTGKWERKLKRIEQQKGDLERFLKEIEEYVREVVEEVFSDNTSTEGFYSEAGSEAPPVSDDTFKKKEAGEVSTRKSGTEGRREAERATEDLHGREQLKTGEPPPEDMEEWDGIITGAEFAGYDEVPPDVLEAEMAGGRDYAEFIENPSPVRTKKEIKHPENLDYLLREIFGFKDFRRYQKSICSSIIGGNDALVVMPTGMGKSLCYQLPGIALQGTTLVISPLIALMEDQTAKLKEMGFNAERIHSGRSRLESRAVCRSYLQGELDFLFIAPERLGVKGFPEMLARYKPVLIAIDEAHCISHWGHDFRPDYRLLGERLPVFRSSPVVAMTATATPRVQQDILDQLGLKDGRRFIHGFRRTNIAIEVVELPPAQRQNAAYQILKEPDALPAIVYASTRKKTESMAEEFGYTLRAAAYHAGLTPRQREQVQTGFLKGELDVIVATIAFGMGIDKPDIRTVIHTALPGTLEGYYQEIGRAGRDGKLSRAVLFHSYADCKIHEFFLEKNYPPASVVKAVYNELTDDKIPKNELLFKLNMDEELYENALEKLWIHHGVEIDPLENLMRGDRQWLPAYLAQRDHKAKQLDDMRRFAESCRCRMLHLVKYFGDKTDTGESCGICDFCNPETNVATQKRALNNQELEAGVKIMDTLRNSRGLGTSRLFKETCANSSINRKQFEALLFAMARSGLLTIRRDSFEKNGQLINYRRVEMKPEARRYSSAMVYKVHIDDHPLWNSVESKSKTGYGKRKDKKKKDQKIQKKAERPKNPHVYEALKKWRLQTARKINKPAFIIFGNKTLEALSRDLPKDRESLLEANGIGPHKAKQYGKEILRVINEIIGPDR